MNELDLQRDARPVVAQVSLALRMARRRRRLSQRELALQIGVSKSQLARLESDAGPQSLEMVCQVLMASGFRLQVVAASGARHPESATSDPGMNAAATLLGLCDASGRRFPAHLDAYPPLYWFWRNGGWITTRAFPEWNFERRYVPRTPPPPTSSRPQS